MTASPPGAPAPYPVRPVSPDEFAQFRTVDEHAFHGRPPGERWLQHQLRQLEFDRTLAAFDGTVPVGIAAIYSLRLCVPGAMTAAAGVTSVAVMPTYRRRGITSSLMRRQLADISERGEALAVLYASEAGIYGRYGYGPASWTASLRLRRGEGTLGGQSPAARAAQSGTTLRIAEPASARATLAGVYDRVLPTRPGMFARDELWWDRALGLHMADSGHADADPLRCLLAEDASGARGYALYYGTNRWDEETGLADSTLAVREMIADGPAAVAAIWSDLLGRDLTTEFTAPMRPVDDPLLYLLADARRARTRVGDGLWARLVDVPAALATRRYASPADVVIEVADALLPANQGRWRLRALRAGGQAGGGQPGLPASCEPADGPADLSLDVSSLGAAYLGGTRLGALAGAGLVTEHRGGALLELSAAMSWDPAPWCPAIF